MPPISAFFLHPADLCFRQHNLMQPGTTQTDHSVWTRPPTASEPSGRDATPPLVPASMFLRTPASTHFISKWPRLAASLHPPPTAVSMDRRRCAAGSQLAQKSPLAGRPCERCHPPRNNAEEAPERVRRPADMSPMSPASVLAPATTPPMHSFKLLRARKRVSTGLPTASRRLASLR